MDRSSQHMHSARMRLGRAPCAVEQCTGLGRMQRLINRNWGRQLDRSGTWQSRRCTAYSAVRNRQISFLQPVDFDGPAWHSGGPTAFHVQPEIRSPRQRACGLARSHGRPAQSDSTSAASIITTTSHDLARPAPYIADRWGRLLIQTG